MSLLLDEGAVIGVWEANAKESSKVETLAVVLIGGRVAAGPYANRGIVIFQLNTIVEFKYSNSKLDSWRKQHRMKQRERPSCFPSIVCTLTSSATQHNGSINSADELTDFFPYQHFNQASP